MEVKQHFESLADLTHFQRAHAGVNLYQGSLSSRVGFNICSHGPRKRVK